MIADGGVGKMGTTYQYYVCKTARKHKCNKKRVEKNELELAVTEITMEYLSDKRRVQKIADDMIAYHGRRTDTAVLRSLEVRMASTQKEMDDTTTAYVQAVATQNALSLQGCRWVPSRSLLVRNPCLLNKAFSAYNRRPPLQAGIIRYSVGIID